MTFVTQKALPELKLTEEVHDQAVGHEVWKHDQMSQSELLTAMLRL